MGKKTKKDKEIAKLRREVEALRAQASVGQPVSKAAHRPRSRAGPLRGMLVEKPTKEKTEKIASPMPVRLWRIRADLRKTVLLTAACLGILLLLTLTQSRWSGILK